jgi:hypothetical protein
VGTQNAIPIAFGNEKYLDGEEKLLMRLGPVRSSRPVAFIPPL